LTPFAFGALLALASPASATTGLAWKFPAEGLRYAISAHVDLPTVLAFEAEQNDEFRSGEFQLDAIVDCVPSPLGKSAWELHCTIEDVSIGAVPVETDAKSVSVVLDELDTKLSKAWVQIQFTADGRVKDIDLEDVANGSERAASAHETLRVVLTRAFAALDLELPPKGDDKGRGAWRTDNLLATRYVSENGTLGTVAAVHAAQVDAAGIATITTDGKGVIQSSETVGATGMPLFTWDVALSGTAKFDTARGVLLERQYFAKATPTSSSSGALGGSAYLQKTKIWLLAADEHPTLAPSGPMVHVPFE
jgi:hypothetical protein